MAGMYLWKTCTSDQYMAVSEQNVRDFLDGTPATSVLAVTVTTNITRSKNFVDQVKQTGTTTAQDDDATAAMAVWLTYGSFMEGMTEMLGGISLADETKINHYRKVAELFLGQVAGYTIDLDDPTKGLETQAQIPIDPSSISLSLTEAYAQL